MVHGWINFSRFLYPPHCLLCRAPVPAQAQAQKQASDQIQNIALCTACHADLPWQLQACQRCALPLGHSASDCGACQRLPPPFDRAIVPLRYAWPLDRLLARFKFSHRLSYGRLLAQLLADAIPRHSLPDAIVPVPLHYKRLRQRGFNQAHELAYPLAQQLDLPVLTKACLRERETGSQLQLDAAARRRNLRGAFTANSAKIPPCVAIVDDVMTTGSTVMELARTLKRAGAKTVHVWCIARAA